MLYWHTEQKHLTAKLFTDTEVDSSYDHTESPMSVFRKLLL